MSTHYLNANEFSDLKPERTFQSYNKHTLYEVYSMSLGGKVQNCLKV